MQILDLLGLTDFLEKLLAKLDVTFSKLGHKHTKSEITDYVVDSAFSSTSTNPIQNKVVNNVLVTLSNEVAYIDKNDNEYVSAADLLPTAEGSVF